VHHAVGGRVGFEASATTVRHLGRALLQEQATLRRGGEQAATAGFLGEELKVLAGFEAEQRELETVLAAGLAVATTAVATMVKIGTISFEKLIGRSTWKCSTRTSAWDFRPSGPTAVMVAVPSD